MDTSAADLEARQLGILRRIEELELAAEQRRLGALSLSDGEAEVEPGGTEVRLSALLAARGVRDFAFRRVPADYYDRSLEERREILAANSVAQLCKSIVMVRPLPFHFVTASRRTVGLHNCAPLCKMTILTSLWHLIEKLVCLYCRWV
jgi:hypothetical protein